MFSWLHRRDHAHSDAIPEINRHTDLDRLFREDLIVIFKHSPSCPVSWAAHAHVMRFRQSNPEVPVHMVCVLKERAVARQIAERTRVRHESPQIILLRRGEVTADASHGGISSDRLAGMVFSDQLLPR